jgi:chromosome segregation ATPase
LLIDQRSLIQEISQLKTKLAEASKERSEAEVKLRLRESDYSQISYELSELGATKKALSEQLKTVREDLDEAHSNMVKHESSKKRLLKDLDEARSQLLLTGDEKVAALAQQIQDREKELSSVLFFFSFLLATCYLPPLHHFRYAF